MLKGIIFDIKEFSINDGPGVRTTIFMKGCPLKCVWCHNPEGISPNPQKNLQTQRVVGKEWTVDELVSYLSRYNDFFNTFGGGITFSGGEPTRQADFILECLKSMPNVCSLLDTSGYCEEKKFAELAEQVDLFYFDLKLADETEHIKYTGVSNKRIINNLRYLMKLKKNTTIRIPMIPHITDTEGNLAGLREIIYSECEPLDIEVHLLPYNTVAGGKYPVYGMVYPLQNSYSSNNIAAITNFQEALEKQGYKVINYVDK